MIPTQSSPLRGILLKSLSVVVFTVMSSLVKATAGGALPIPPGQQMFFRSFFAIPVILVWLAMRGELGVGLRTHRPMGHFYRGLVGSAAMCMSFWALALLPLPEVTAIGFLNPIVVTIGATLLMGERISWRRAAAIGVALAGAMIVGRMETLAVLALFSPQFWRR